MSGVDSPNTEESSMNCQLMKQDTHGASLSPEKERNLLPCGQALRTRCSVREADTGHAGCDSTDGKRPEQADPQTQRVGSWLLGAWGEEG